MHPTPTHPTPLHRTRVASRTALPLVGAGLAALALVAPMAAPAQATPAQAAPAQAAPARTAPIRQASPQATVAAKAPSLTLAWSDAAKTTVRTTLGSRTLTKGDVGATISMRLTPTAGATLQCQTQKLSRRSSGASAAVAHNWSTSGCWTGGVNLVTTVTRVMVGQQLVLAGTARAASKAGAVDATGEVTIASQKQTAHASLKPAVTAKPIPVGTNVVAGKVPANAMSGLPRIPWEGGVSYYKRFPDAVRGGWANTSHFPIALWWGQVSSDNEVAYDKSKGINTYVVTNPQTDYRLFDRNGVSYVGHRLSGQPRDAKSWVGDYLDDEVDARFSATEGRAVMDKLAGALPENDKFRYANYTAMVVSWQEGNSAWQQASRDYVNKWTDVVSLDAYWYSSPQCDWANPNGHAYLAPFGKANCRTPQAYGRNVAALRQQDTTDGKLQPAWNFIENVDAAPNGRTEHVLTPAEVKGAAMSSIINEARGIVWFNNSFGGRCETGNAIRATQTNPSYPCSSTVNAMGEVNNLIHSVAPVLSTQSYRWNFGAGTQTMLKFHGGSAYIFAMPSDAGARSGAGTKTFRVPPLLKGRTVEVVGQKCTIRMAPDGTFTDRFATVNDYRIYRIR